MGRHRHLYRLYKRDGTYYVWYYDEFGKRKKRSLYTANPSEADRLAYQIMMRKSKVPTFREYSQPFFTAGTCPWYADEIAGGRSVTDQWLQTRKNYIRDYFNPAFGDFMIDQISCKLIKQWFSKLERSMQTKKHLRSTLHTIFEYAVNSGDLDDNPVDGVMSFTPADNPKEAFTDEELIELQKKALAHGLRTFCMVRLFVVTGFRRGELAGLLEENVIKGGVFSRGVLRANGEWKAKTRASQRVIPIDPFTENVLRVWISRKEKSRWLWPGGKEDTPLTPKSVDRAIRPIIESLETKGERNLSLHSFRYSFNSAHLDYLDLEAVQKMTGHVTDKMSSHYDRATAERALRRLENRVSLQVFPVPISNFEDVQQLPLLAPGRKQAKRSGDQ